MLEQPRGRLKRSCSSRTFHSNRVSAAGAAAQTKNGLLGTRAKDVKTASHENRHKNSASAGKAGIKSERAGRNWDGYCCSSYHEVAVGTSDEKSPGPTLTSAFHGRAKHGMRPSLNPS